MDNLDISFKIVFILVFIPLSLFLKDPEILFSLRKLIASFGTSSIADIYVLLISLTVISRLSIFFI